MHYSVLHTVAWGWFWTGGVRVGGVGTNWAWPTVGVISQSNAWSTVTVDEVTPGTENCVYIFINPGFSLRDYDCSLTASFLCDHSLY